MGLEDFYNCNNPSRTRMFFPVAWFRCLSVSLKREAWRQPPARGEAWDTAGSHLCPHRIAGPPTVSENGRGRLDRSLIEQYRIA
jgi:hypothetical protein